MRNIIKKKKCLLFKHEKNNQTLSNDWLTYCHTGIYAQNVLTCKRIVTTIIFNGILKKFIMVALAVKYKINIITIVKLCIRGYHGNGCFTLSIIIF
jgi:hypothetical protein